MSYWISSNESLNKLCDRLENEKLIALDTEFIRTDTFFPKLALIQISDGSKHWLVDVLSVTQYDAFKSLLESPARTIIFHACGEDIEVLDHTLNINPPNIFDTQIASNFIFEKSNVGYSTLVKNLCNCDIKEGSWRTNWLERPLSTKKVEYAADDVRYLIEIKSLLIKRLKALDRFSWFEEEQLNELKKSNIIIEPNEAWKKINYPLHFSTQELALLKNIACWREELAIKYDIPKRWIFSDSSATKLMLKNDKKTMDVVNNIKQQLTDSEMSKLMKILSLKKVIKNKNLSPKKDIEKKCNELLGYVSDEFNIDSTIIATKRDLEIFTNTNSEARFMKGWRYQIFGKLVQ